MSHDLNYGVAVENFGPIANADITLRPLTIFVGPSNTGKSYLAILLYALHQAFGSRFGRWDRAGLTRLLASRVAWSVREDLNDRSSRVSATSQTELPVHVVEDLRRHLEEASGQTRGLRHELCRCFGVDSPDMLIRRSSAKTGAKLELTCTRSSSAPGIRYAIKLAKSHEGLTGSISGIDTQSILDAIASIDDGRKLIERVVSQRGTRADWPDWVLQDILGRLFATLFRPLGSPAYYLPADRTGVMHSHQVVVSAIVQSAATAGLRKAARPDIPVLSGVLADFLSELIEMSQQRRTRKRKRGDLGSQLEERILEGAVRLDDSETGYPLFAYRPKGWKDDLPLMRASSMVSELAPVVLYLRHVVRENDLLIIEEPESHLHPAKQAAFARELAGLVRRGVRIIMTTHSDWFLEQFANLVRLSRLPEGHQEDLHDEGYALRPDQVGAWLFKQRRDSTGSVVEEVVLDEETGLYPTDFDDVSETLYNQGARIFNRSQDVNGA